MIRNRSDTDPRQQRKRHNINPSILFRYPFLIQLLSQYLNDKDVMTSLLLVDHDIRYDLQGYCLKRRVDQYYLPKDADLDRTLPVRASWINVKSLPIVIPTDPNNSSVKVIEFDYNFKQLIPIGSIPVSVLKLTFGRKFNQPIPPGTIPPEVADLTFDWWFNQLISQGTIPQSVTNLTFGHEFNRPVLPGCIPLSVTNLLVFSVFYAKSFRTF